MKTGLPLDLKVLVCSYTEARAYAAEVASAKRETLLQSLSQLGSGDWVALGISTHSSSSSALSIASVVRNVLREGNKYEAR